MDWGQMTPVLFAELSLDGDVDCVWEWRKSPPIFRPLTAEGIPDIDLKTAEFSGAPREKIVRWIKEHAGRFATV